MKKEEMENISEEEKLALEEIKELVKTTLEIKKADKTNKGFVKNSRAA